MYKRKASIATKNVSQNAQGQNPQKQSKIEERKKLYRRSIQHKKSTHQESLSLYSKDFLRTKIAPESSETSSLIKNILQNASAIYSEAQSFTEQSKAILNECFREHELSFTMISNIILKINENLKGSLQAINEFLTPFLGFFDGLHTEAQREILTKAHTLLQRVQAQKDISVDLCIKLSSIKAQNTLKKESVFLDYLKEMVQNLGKYAQE